MLTKQRIKEAEQNVKIYLNDRLLKKEKNQNENILRILNQNAKDSLQMAHLANANNSFLWTIVCAYYSMFYIANAILYSYGYKVGSKIAHKVTADALIVHIRNKLNKSILDQYEEVQKQALNFMNANDLVLQFDLEREKRNRVQYSTTELIKNAKAKTSLERAKRFYTEMRKLII